MQYFIYKFILCRVNISILILIQKTNVMYKLGVQKEYTISFLSNDFSILFEARIV